MKTNFSLFNTRTDCMNVRNINNALHLKDSAQRAIDVQKKPADTLSFGGFKNINFAQIKKIVEPYIKPDRKAFDLGESLAAEVPNWAKKVAGSKKFQTLLNKTRDNPAVIQALVELGVVGVVRSLIVVVTPGVKKGDKETSISKNVVSALTGYTLSNLVFKPIGKATKKLLKNPEKYIRSQKVLDNLNGVGMKDIEASQYKTALHNLWNKGPDIFLAPLKSMLTVALIPVVMKILFKDNPKVKEANKNNNPQNNPVSNEDISNMIIDKNIKNALSTMQQKGAQV